MAQAMMQLLAMKLCSAVAQEKHLPHFSLCCHILCVLLQALLLLTFTYVNGILQNGACTLDVYSGVKSALKVLCVTTVLPVMRNGNLEVKDL